MEIWDAYDADGTKSDRTLIRDEEIPEGLYHLVCEVLLRHRDGEYLVMRRDLNKRGWPGAWEATAGGSALQGEDEWACARRELREETGIEGDDFTLIGRKVFDHEICFSFLAWTDAPKEAVRLQAGETIDYRWITEQDFVRFLHCGDGIPEQHERMRAYFQAMGCWK